MMDDVNTANVHLGSRTIAKYPTWTAIQNAYEGFLAAVGPGLTGAGFLAMPNIGFPYATSAYVDVYRRFISYTSGSLREYGSAWSSGQVFGGAWWDFVHQLHQATAAVGKAFLSVDYGSTTDAAHMRYARASFLLDSSDRDSLMYTPLTAKTDPWAADWTDDVGEPVGPATNVLGVWRRDFTGGTVVVNPSETLPATVSLGGTFITASGSSVTTLSLDPKSGAILHLPTVTASPDAVSQSPSVAPAPVPVTTAAAPTPVTSADPELVPSSSPTPSPTPSPTAGATVKPRGWGKWKRLVSPSPSPSPASNPAPSPVSSPAA
jgi:hypothetical protein